jgi:alpha-glucosidase
MYSHNERMYERGDVNQIPEGDFCSLPVLFGNPDGAKILFTETALTDYPNMFLEMGQKQKLESIFPKFVLEAIPDTESGPDRNQKITKEAEFIAKVSGPRQYPWRVFIVGEDDKVLIESNLAYQLAPPSVIEDVSWIKPGKVAWDWYNANNIYGVDFESGLNTKTYRYYIDFAAENGIEYVIFDEGWTKSTTEILGFNPDMDVKGLIQYAESKGVGIILWVLWKPLSENLTEILATYKSWGARGIKVDFMQRSDQAMVVSYEAIAKEAARLHLLVDFHGAFKPSGLQLTYPNVLNFEGVKGSENNKWSDLITPDHNLTIPFIRMAAGPMDYTPGAMNNAGKRDYAISWARPMSQGTRCQQVAMYVIYEAPLQMMCESPSTYRREQETVDFIRKIPTTWDETKVLEAKIGDNCIVARRKGSDWFIGGLTDWTERKFEIPLDFLSGSYDATIIADGVNADHFAEDYQIRKQILSEKDVLKVEMKSGGGFAVILKRK